MRKKTNSPIVFLLLAIIVCNGFIPLLSVHSVVEQPNNESIYPDEWFDYNWLNRWRININWTKNELLYDFQLRITFPSTFNYSKIKTDGSDIRFTDYRNNMIKYWIENWNTEGISRVWVKVPRINGNPTDPDFIYLYTGNPNAESLSNGTETFSFFEDFEEEIVGNRAEDWQVMNDYAGDIIISDDSIIGDKSAHYSDTSFSDYPHIQRAFNFDAKNHILEYYVRPNNFLHSGGMAYSPTNSFTYGGNLIFYYETISLFYWDGVSYNPFFDSLPHNEWYRITVSFRNQLSYNMTIHHNIDGIVGEAIGLPIVGTNNSICYFDFWDFSNHRNSLNIDCIRIREGTNYWHHPSTSFIQLTSISLPESDIIGYKSIMIVFNYAFIMLVIIRGYHLKRKNKHK